MRQNRRKDLSYGLCAMLIAGLVSVAAAAPSYRLSLTRKIVGHVDGLAKITNSVKQHSALRALLSRYFDFDAFETKVLKDVLPSFTKAQRQRFSTAFRDLFVDYLFSKLQNMTAEWSLNRCLITAGPAADIVTIAGTYEQSDFDVVVYWGTAKLPRVTDVAVSGALLSRNYRAMVNKTVRAHGIEELIVKLREKKKSLVKTP